VIFAKTAPYLASDDSSHTASTELALDGGSPGGDKDEVCAQAGVAKAAELLKR